MKRRFAYTVGTVALVLLMSTAALAVIAPHNFNCTECHVVHRSLGVKDTNNVCISCHYQGSVLTVHQFKPTDLANPFGTTAMGIYTSGTGKHSSHNWAAPDQIPAAGATPPTNSYMNTPTSILGTVSCARCHEVHSLTTDFTGTNPIRSQPLLRMRNDTDQMCLDCHKSRNKPDALQGTHPVNFGYNDANRGPALQPNNYYSTPITNPTNPTANMKLIGSNGLVLCSTCHAPHFVDSNARTFDSNSSAILGRLSSSRGLLLRTDLKGKAVTDLNICVNCHKSNDTPGITTAAVKNHNGSSKNQNVQCADCHGGHVDYDPADPTGSLGKNVWLINRYMNISTPYGAVRNKRVLFQYTSSTQKNYNKDAYGVCLGCHSPLPSTIAQHSSTDATVCNTCHKHSAGFSANCTQCHGFPPTTNLPPTGTSGSTGYAVDGSKNYSATTPPYKDESQTPHGSHAAGGGTNYSYGCTECHNGNNHDSGNFQQVFPVASATLVSNGKGAVAAPAYNTASPGTCTTYCHSNGAPRGQTYKTKAPTWALTRGTIIGTANECVACHGGVITGFNNLSTNAHFKHVSNNAATGKGYTCNVCHAATVSGNSAVSNQANHVNGVKDVSFSGVAAGSTMNTSATCTTYCHSNGTSTTGIATVYAAPSWATPSTGKCGSCHKVSLAIASQGTLIDTNAHFAHMSSTYGPKYYINPTTAAGSCAICHTYTNELSSTHVNGTIEVPSTNCTTNCHKNGIAIAGGWNVGRVTCESCHTGTLSVINGLTAPAKTNFTATGHGQSGTNYNASNQCVDCHDPNSPHISGAVGTYKRIAVNNNTLCYGCHNNATKVPTVAKQNVSTHVTAMDGNPTMDCKACHDVHGTSYTKMVRTQVMYGIYSSVGGLNYDGTNFVQTVAPYRGLCQGCHTKTNHFKRNVPETNHPTTNCLGCHAHKEAYAFKPKACDFCHGYPPADRNATFGRQGIYSSARFEDYTSGGGAHTKAGHIKPTAKPSEGWANCTVCHGNGSLSPANTHTNIPSTAPYTPSQTNINMDVDDHYKFNSSLPLGRAQYSGTLNNNTTGSCSNVSCHFKPTPKWGPK